MKMTLVVRLVQDWAVRESAAADDPEARVEVDAAAALGDAKVAHDEVDVDVTGSGRAADAGFGKMVQQEEGTLDVEC